MMHSGRVESISKNLRVQSSVKKTFSFSSAGRRESHDAVRACISMPCAGPSPNDMQGHADIIGDPKVKLIITLIMLLARGQF